MSEWIRVSERLPSKDGNYLIYDINKYPKNRCPLIGYFEITKGFFLLYSTVHEKCFENNEICVTHWHSLPEAPEDLC